MCTANQLIVKGNARESWPDILRVVAIFQVILIHSCGASFYKFGEIALTDWLFANFLDSLSRSSVPLFVMLSGALLLRSNAPAVTIRQILNRVTKVVVPLLVWGGGFLFYVSYYSGQPVEWSSLITKTPMYHLWFVYMIVGLYLFLPIFEALFEFIKDRKGVQGYFLALWLLITSMPVYLPMPLFVLLQQTNFLGYGGYFLIGAMLIHSPYRQVPSVILLVVYALSVATTFLLTYYFSNQSHSAVETAYQYFSPNVFVSSFAAFMLFSRMKLASPWAQAWSWLSDKVFLIFFVHVVVLERVSNSMVMQRITSHLPIVLSILLIALTTFLLSLMFASAIRLLPGSKSVLG